MLKLKVLSFVQSGRMKINNPDWPLLLVAMVAEKESLSIFFTIDLN